MIVLDPKKFGVSEKQIKSYLKTKVKDWGYYDDAERIEGAVVDAYNNLVEGDKDVDTTVEMMAMKKGWCRFAQSNQWVNIKGSGKLDNLRQACIILDQKHGIFSEGKPVQNLELALKAPSGKMDVKTRGTWGINATDIKRWLRHGGDPNKLPKEKELERQDVTKARMSGRHPPGHDEWGPVKGRGSKKWRKIYAHKLPSFKDFIVELASPYETNPYVKKALKKYDDPVKFLLNMMHLVPKLPRMGKKNTLELVKVWNDNKSKKINVALVEQVLSEEKKLNLKGWIHVSGKSVLSNIRSGYKPYHMQILTRSPREFGVKKSELKSVLKKEYDEANAEEIDQFWDELVEGVYDKERSLSEYMYKKGWAEVVFENGNNSIIMGDNPKPRDMQKIAYEIDKTYSDSQLFPDPSAYFEIIMKGKRVDIDSIMDFRTLIKTGKVPTRSKIGRTMAQFREARYVTEKPAKLSATFPYKGARWDDFRGAENPSEKEIVTLMKKSKMKEIRFVVDIKGKMWAWDTDDALHDAVIYAQTGEKYNGNYAKGIINFFDIDDEGAIAPKSGNLRIVIMNTRTVGSDFALKNRTMKALAKRINSKGDDQIYWSDI